jgi:hypothetical protein
VILEIQGQLEIQVPLVIQVQQEIQVLEEQQDQLASRVYQEVIRVILELLVILVQRALMEQQGIKVKQAIRGLLEGLRVILV